MLHVGVNVLTLVIATPVKVIGAVTSRSPHLPPLIFILIWLLAVIAFAQGAVSYQHLG